MRTGALLTEVLAALESTLARAGSQISGASNDSSGGAVLDLGGGTGGIAVHLAQRGHRVTVVDPSPDSLAALARRADETGTVDRIQGVQGDATDVGSLIPAGSIDLVLCHTVLEYVDDPLVALHTVTTTLRPGGLLSVLAANRVAAVTARVGAGRLAEAVRLLCDPAGRVSDSDPLARRFTVEQLQRLLAGAGLHVRTLHGVRVFADLAPAAAIDDPVAAGHLLALEEAAARDPSYLPIATQLHAVCEQQP